MTRIWPSVLLALCLFVPTRQAVAQQRVAVVVGVAGYRNGYRQLDCASDDAMSVAGAFRALKYDVKVVATAARAGWVLRSDVLRALNEAAEQCGPEDTFAFYFAGHGESDGTHGYLLSSDSKPGSLTETAVAVDGSGAETIETILKGCKAAKRLVIIDACRVEGTRGAPETKLSPAFQERLSKTISESGKDIGAETATIWACALGQASIENLEAKAGVFTQVLVQALGSPDAAADGELTTGSVIKYVSKNMPDYVAGKQTPVLVGSDKLPIGEVSKAQPNEGSGAQGSVYLAGTKPVRSSLSPVGPRTVSFLAKFYTNSLGLCGNSARRFAVYDIPPGYTQFRATVGVDDGYRDSQRNPHTVVFTATARDAEGKVVATVSSPGKKVGQPGYDLALQLGAAVQLELAEVSSPFMSHKNAFWGDARFGNGTSEGAGPAKRAHGAPKK